MRSLAQLPRIWWLAVVVIAVAATLSVSALPTPSPVIMTFAKTIETQAATIQVFGYVLIDAANRSANGTVHLSVTNATGALITEVDLSFWNNGTVTGPFTEDMIIPEASLALHLSVNPTTRSVSVTVDLFGGTHRGRH